MNKLMPFFLFFFALVLQTALGFYSQAAEDKDVFQTDYKAKYKAELDGIDKLIELEKRTHFGDAEASYQLAMILIEGRFVVRDYDRAFEWLLRAAKRGSSPAKLELGDMYYYGRGAARNYEEALKWYKRAAVESGAVQAAVKLARAYESGLGAPQDYKKAVEWYEKAAEQGHSFAQIQLYNLYESEESVKDSKKARIWLEEAARGGDRGSLAKLEAIKKEEAKAYRQNTIEGYKKAADGGDAASQYKLGVMSYYGAGAPRDYKEAFKWFQKAAEAGNMNAGFHLARMLFYGHSVDQDYEEAFKWHEKAARQGGHVIAQNNLAGMYYLGQGAPKNHTLAYAWLIIAASNDKAFERARDALAKKLSSAQKAEGEKQAQRISEEIGCRGLF